MGLKNRLTIGIYGAFDRFNYGDLLFPIVIKKALDERFSDLNYRYYGLIDSDLSKFGGVPTTAIKRRLKTKLNDNQKEIFIVGGGEILNTSMFYLYQCFTSNNYIRKIFNHMYRTFGINFSNNLCRHLLAYRLRFPYIINRNLLSSVECFIYNTVGGNLPEGSQEIATNYLRQADFISVRDKETRDNLIHAVPDINSYLFPDSASVISKYFSKDSLMQVVSSDTISFLNNHRNGYICFQISSSSYEINSNEINKQLASLFRKTMLPILLLPIGRAPWHHDQYALKSIQLSSKYEYFMPSENTIWDIMALIANASLFIGTSLHGVITSMSYSVPYVPINPNIKKMKRYLESWSNLNYNCPISYSSICNTAIETLGTELSSLEKQQKYILEKVDKNFDAIANCINNSIHK